MWISKEQFLALVHERSQSQGVAQALEKQNIALQSTMDWLKVRLTQLEHERAQLIHNYMGVKIAVPSFEPERPSIQMSDILGATQSFDDVGDEEAAKQGIGWDLNGEVVYSKKTR